MENVTEQFDLYLTNAEIVTAHERYKGNIGVKNGKIAAILPRGTEVCSTKILDLTGKCIFPGIWHTHCHFRDPGQTQKEDFETGSRAAAAGGITMAIDMTNNTPAPATPETFLEKKKNAEAKSYIDFGLYGAGLYPEQVKNLAELGAIGIKVFNTRHPMDAYPYIPTLAVTDHGILYEIYEEVAKTGLVCAVHHDDSDWTRTLVQRDYIQKGRVSAEDYIEAYDRGYMYGHGMVSGLASSLYLAKVAGARLYVLHVGVMPEMAYDYIQFAKSKGQTVYSELEACSFLIDREMVEKIKTRTYLFAHDVGRAYDYLNNDTDTLVLEHAPHTLKEITDGLTNNFNAPLGVIGVQEFLPLMLNEVNNGNLTLERLLYLTTESPARIFGQYPMKGAIAIGSDADFTVVDMEREKVLTDKDELSKSGWTAFDGVKVKGVPTHTIVRGNIVFEEGEIKGKPGYGHMVKGTAYKGK